MARPRKAKVKLPPHVHAVRARGKDYYYFQPFRGTARQNERIKLPGCPANRDGTPNEAWWAAYRQCTGEPLPKARAGTFAALITEYKYSPEWNQLSSNTQRDYGRYLDHVNALWGKLLVAGVEARHVLALRDAKADTPGAANYLIRTLSAMMSWSIPRGYRKDNPCEHVRKLKLGEGYAPWTWEHIAHFRENVSKPELWWAASVALFSGQRQEDDLSMQWSDCGDGVISVVQEKTGKKVWVPMHRDLRSILDDVPRRSGAILTNTRGKPWTGSGFRASWGKELDRPQMKCLRDDKLVFHGLRKSAVVFLLEAGCTDAEVSAVTGQSRQMVEHYARQVNQKKLAAKAVLKWEFSEEGGLI